MRIFIPIILWLFSKKVLALTSDSLSGFGHSCSRSSNSNRSAQSRGKGCLVKETNFWHVSMMQQFAFVDYAIYYCISDHFPFSLFKWHYFKTETKLVRIYIQINNDGSYLFCTETHSLAYPQYTHNNRILVYQNKFQDSSSALNPCPYITSAKKSRRLLWIPDMNLCHA